MVLDPTSAPSTETESAKPSDASGSGSDIGDMLLKALGAVGTGIGILGFVTLFGGAILWLRADQSHLPANDAVSVIPNSVLVTTGASFLIPAVLIATLAVVVIFMVHFGFDLPRKISNRDDLRQAHALEVEAETLARGAKPKEEHAKAARALAVSLTEAAEQIKQNPAASEATKAQQDQVAATQRHAAEQAEAEAFAAKSVADAKKVEADNLRAEVEFALERSTRQVNAELVVGVVALILLPPLLNGAIFHVGFWRGFVLFCVAVLVAIVSLLAYVGTERFIWFGVVAFVMVGIYIGFATYFSTTKNPKVEPAAALRAGHPPVVGTFIADTASNLYLGSFANEERTPRLMVVPRAQVTDLDIGPLVNPGRAPQRAAQMALASCRQKVEVPAAEGQPAILRPACRQEDEEALAALLE